MGRQIQICTTDSDNENFHSFIKENFNCVLFQSFALKKQEITLRDFRHNLYSIYNNILIWNKQFKWEPTYKQTSTKEKLFYIENAISAPVIEFTKTNWKTLEHGRIYWSKDFAGPVNYNLKEFESFYNSLTKWIIKNSKGTTKWANCNIYFLEEAWKFYSKRK